MAKRSATEVVSVAPPVKKLHLEGIDSPSDEIPSTPLDDDDDPTSVAHTPASEAPSSPTTGVTTPRTKFPSDLKKFPCTWEGCSKTFNRPARLRDHLNSHTNSRPFKCPYADCDKDYTVDKHLRQHIKATHTNERRYICEKEGCGKSFVTGTRLKRHQLVHEGEERLKCKTCGQSFRKKTTLAKHVRKEHEGLPSYACPEEGCSAAFDHPHSLKKHQDKEHGELKYWCADCGVKTHEDGTEERVGFTTQSLLEAHLRTEHQNCMFCDFRSASRWEHEQHVEMYHSGKTLEERKKEACPHPNCGRKFTRKSNLNSHIRSAHAGQVFICGETQLDNVKLNGWSNDQGCGTAFSAKGRLEDHVRYVHLKHARPANSRSVPSPSDQADAFIDNLFPNILASNALHCTYCVSTFNSQAELDTHISMDHDMAFLDESPLQPLFGEQEPLPSAWLDDAGQEEIFAAQMDYEPVDDGWAEDEANIMLLARDPIVDEAIDPALEDF